MSACVEAGSIVTWTGAGECDVSYGVAIKFGRPCADEVVEGEPRNGVGNAFDGVAVGCVNLDENFGEGWEIVVGARPDEGFYHSSTLMV